MQQLTRQDIEEVVNSVLEARRGIEAAQHLEDHMWIRAQREADLARKEMYKKIMEAFMQWSVIGIATWLFTHFASYFGISGDKISGG